MIPKQSTTALPDRLTQGFSAITLFLLSNLVALYPHIHKYLPKDCGHSKLDFYPNSTYTREKCLQECAYKGSDSNCIKSFGVQNQFFHQTGPLMKAVMEKCQCRPPYFPKYKDYDNCTFSMHASCISPNFTVFNFTTCVNCPVECEKNR